MDNVPFIFEGQVVKTDDPDQMGRVKVWIPALDGDNFDIDHLPWADYASPLAGFTVDFPAGSEGQPHNAHTAYGFWAIPKMGASVLVFCLGGDSSLRCFFASTIRLHRNRSLPTGRNLDSKGATGPWGDAGDSSGNLFKIEPAYSNLRDQFQGDVTASESITRGVFERQVAQPIEQKDGKEGYSKTPVVGEKYLDSQTYCWVTPGRHALIFQDSPEHARCRLKTADGHQVILDDANERIYVSTAKGKTWIELDIDGHVNIFGSESVSIRAGTDLNLFADNNVNIEAGKAVNIKADKGDIRASAGGSLHISSVGAGFIMSCADLNHVAEGSLKLTSTKNFHVKAGAEAVITPGKSFDVRAGTDIKLQGTRIDLNGPTPKTADEADCAKVANDPSIVPGHEPWKRPVSKNKRGKNWKA